MSDGTTQDRDRAATSTDMAAPHYPVFSTSRQNMTPPPSYQELVNHAEVPPPSYSSCNKSLPSYPPPSYNEIPVYDSIVMPASSRRRSTEAVEDIPDHMAFAVAALFFFWPLGVLAVMKANDVRAAKAAGDVIRARLHSQYAWRLSYVAICTSLILICFLFVPITIFLKIYNA